MVWVIYLYRKKLEFSSIINGAGSRVGFGSALADQNDTDPHHVFILCESNIWEVTREKLQSKATNW